MTGPGCVVAFLSVLSVMMIGSFVTIRHHHDRFGLNRRGTNRRSPHNERNRKNKGCEYFHLARRFRRIGQRITRSAVPARPSSNPPIAKASNHHVLKFSWFFQSMMCKLQKKS